MPARSAARSSARFALLAPVGATLFTLAWVILGFLSPGYRLFDMTIEPYSPVAQPVSGLGLGVTGPWMNTAFITCGLLIAAGLFAACRTWPVGSRTRTRQAAGTLLTVSGIGMSLCGLFTLESVLPHLVGFLLAVGAPGVGSLLAGVTLRRADRWLSTSLLAAGPVTLALLIAFFATFDPMTAADNTGVAGLVQRALITATMLTSGLVGYRAWALSRSPRPRSNRPASFASNAA